MTIYAKKVTKEQREWLTNYEQVTGFEPMAQEDIDSGARTFEQVAKANVDWYECHTTDCFLSIANYPQRELT
jgi:hypothetical protein